MLFVKTINSNRDMFYRQVKQAGYCVMLKSNVWL